MMIFRTTILLLFLNIFLFSDDSIDKYLKETNDKFNAINDYRVDMIVSLDIPAFRMPKKKYKVYYKKPDKIKVKARGFGMLPKTGLFTSPSDNFDNLTNLRIAHYKDSLNVNDIMIVGDLIVDSLKLEMPNEYSRLAFDPTVEVRIDTLNWVIKNVTTRLDTLKMFQINNEYKIFNNKYYMPSQSIVKYYVKDKEFFNWINKDAGNIIGKDTSTPGNNSIVEGTIVVDYKDYKINRGIKDRMFDD